LRHSRPHHRARKVFAALVAVAICACIGLFLTSDHAYITTPSMYPTIQPGAMVFVAKQPAYHVGEVIEFRGNGLLWVHRLIAVKDGSLVTKGDNPASTPDVFVPALTTKDVVGSVVFSVPFLGFPELMAHHPSYGLSWLRAELGFAGRLILVLVVGLVASLLVFACGEPGAKTTAGRRRKGPRLGSASTARHALGRSSRPRALLSERWPLRVRRSAPSRHLHGAHAARKGTTTPEPLFGQSARQNGLRGHSSRVPVAQSPVPAIRGTGGFDTTNNASVGQEPVSSVAKATLSGAGRGASAMSRKGIVSG
jgi:signal peptidase I